MLENTEGAKKIDNLEKQATQAGNTKYTAQYVLDTTMRKPTQTTGDKDKSNIVFMWKS